MSGDGKNELDDAVAAIDEAEDIVDLLAILLRICRRHASAVVAASQDARARSQRERLKRAAAAAFTNNVLSARTKKFAIKQLEAAADLAIAARALALGIDLAVQTRDPTAYRSLCRKWGERVLEEGDPYPTQTLDIAPMYGGSEGLSRRPSANAATAFDCVDGLAIWRLSPLRVVYDTVAGAQLDNAMLGRQQVAILAVAPNADLGEFDWARLKITRNGFFRLGVLNTRAQDTVVRDALQLASVVDADIVLTPELSSTPRTVKLLQKALGNIGYGRPRIVIAGGIHQRIQGKRVNRLSTIYASATPSTIPHDKIGEYQIPIEGKQCVENISRSTELRIHAGINWSMIPLICADFLENEVVEAVADLYPRLVIVASMSRKTADFELSMAQVIRKCQALVAMVNGPHDWFSTKPPVVVIGMPLADPVKRIIRLLPTGVPAPYKVLFRSGSREAQFV
jgi:hypothetical protein